jgi:hypothetical protein
MKGRKLSKNLVSLDIDNKSRNTEIDVMADKVIKGVNFFSEFAVFHIEGCFMGNYVYNKEVTTLTNSSINKEK